MEKTRVCAYIRVSTELISQDESLITQKSIIQNLINKNDNEEITENDFFLDRTTGTKISRGKNSDFNKLLSLLGFEIIDEKNTFSIKANPKIKPKYKKIYVKSTSRFSRAGSKGENLLDMFLKRGIEVFYYDLNISSKDINPALLKVQSLVDEQYSLTMSYNWRLYNYRLNQNRELICRQKVFGYDRVKKADNKYYYVINNEEKKILDIIYKMFLEDKIGTTRICDYLNKNGYKNNGKDFLEATVIKILKNERYLGKEKYRKYDKDYLSNFKTKSFNDLEFIWEYCDYVEPIITDEQYKQIMSVFSSRTASNNKGRNSEKNELTKLVICGICKNHYQSNGLNRDKNALNLMCRKTRFKKNYSCNNNPFEDIYLIEEIEKRAKTYKLFLDSFYSRYINDLQYLRIWLVLGYINNSEDEEAELIEKYNEIYSETQILVKNLVKIFSDNDPVKEIIQEQINENNILLSDLKRKIDIQNNLKEEVLNKIRGIAILQEELSERWKNIKKTYSYNEYIKELESITIYPKEKHGRSKNNVIFIFKTKLEDEVFSLFDNVISNNELIDFIGKDKIGLMDKSKLGTTKYIIKQPNKEEIEEVMPYLVEFE